MERDSLLLKALIKAVEVQNTNTSDYPQYTLVACFVLGIPLLWYLIRKWFSDNDKRFEQQKEENTRLYNSLEAAFEKGFDSLGRTIAKTAEELSKQSTKSLLGEHNIEELQHRSYEHLEKINMLLEHKHAIELTMMEYKFKHDATNEMALKNEEKLGELKDILDDVIEKLDNEIKKHDSCTSFKPLHG